MIDDQLKHREEVKDRIRAATTVGYPDFHDILAACEGADPRLVAECIKEIGVPTKAGIPATLVAPRDTFLQLPAADPFRSQWWFSGETVEFICDRVATHININGGRVLCLGAPTVGNLLLSRNLDTVILDVDHDVVSMVNKASRQSTARNYDAADDLPNDLHAAFSVAVIDPPWYDVAATVFCRRALDALSEGGELLMSMPPRLTRPGTDRFRSGLIDSLLKAGNELLSLDRYKVGYLVPRFEEVALTPDIGFRGIPWRRADLLHVRKRGTSIPAGSSALEKVSVATFARSPREFRVFLRDSQSAVPGVFLEILDAYSKNVSTRAHAHESPDVWTTEKVGIRTGNRDLIHAILRVWSEPSVRTRDEAVSRLKADYPGIAENAVQELDRVFGLWSHFATQPPLRTDDEIEAAKHSSLTSWATSPSLREHKHDGDNFRGAYQRDRDRVLWAGAFRRLGHKTQLFPSEHDDQTRQRLTHSIEVMQLASTIGASFGLDRDLIEAGALAHDIGHTPFGHAGEHALHELLNHIQPGLGGFNHYEHGVDVVRWLEGPYYVSQATSFHGLNLTPEVAECILKHTYCHGGPSPSTEHLLEFGKHGDLIQKGYCHLEGQAVRIADKISYFVSDLEDGIRLGSVSIGDLLGCHFFHRSPLNFKNDSRLSPYQSFLAQRRDILRLLMEDVLVATSKRLARTNLKDVRNASRYLADHSEGMLRDVSEVWNRLQVKKLHEDRRVKLANLRAARIVSDLTLLFAASPGFVDADFAAEHARLGTTAYMAYYAKQAGKTVVLPPKLLEFLPLERLIGFKHEPGRGLPVSTEQIVQAKDFVAGLTDSRARALHAEIFGNGVQ